MTPYCFCSPRLLRLPLPWMLKPLTNSSVAKPAILGRSWRSHSLPNHLRTGSPCQKRKGNPAEHAIFGNSAKRVVLDVRDAGYKEVGCSQLLPSDLHHLQRYLLSSGSLSDLQFWVMIIVAVSFSSTIFKRIISRTTYSRHIVVALTLLSSKFLESRIRDGWS
jgi:hypothetical protein